MTVLTDRRSYQFVLRSTGNGAKWYQRVTWQYGNTILVDSPAVVSLPAPVLAEQSALQTGEAVDARSLNFGYVITGDAPFKPLVVFNDGRFTRIKLPPTLQELPALFAVADDDYQLVNYLVKGDDLIVQQVLTSGVLRLGKAEVRFALQDPQRTAMRFGGSEN